MRLRAVFAATVLVLACTGCGQRCVNREIGSHPSPSGKKTALVFSRECGPGAEANVHVHLVAGQNLHHIVEISFKALARALRQATELDPRAAGAVPSTKGTLTE